MNRESIVPTSHCPRCNHSLDRATSINNNDVPDPGSICICICCGTILKYDDDLRLELLSPVGLIKISIEHPEIYRILMISQSVVRRKN